MHETMVAQSVFDSVMAQAQKYGKKPVRVRISCGQFSPVNDEIVNFAFSAISDGTVCEGVRIDVTHVPLKAICKTCGVKFDFDVYSPRCSECDSSEFTFSEDAELLLEEIELED